MKNKNLDSDIQQFASLNYTIVMRNDDEGDVVASIKELDGCIAHGQDSMEALAELETVKRLWIKSCLMDGKPVPSPREEPEELPSGKWLQRVPRILHRKLIDAAKDNDVSLNTFVTSCLSEAIGKQLVSEPGVTVSIQSSAAPTSRSEALTHYWSGAISKQYLTTIPAAACRLISSKPKSAEYRSADDLAAEIYVQKLSQQINLSSRGKRGRPSNDLKEVAREYAYQA